MSRHSSNGRPSDPATRPAPGQPGTLAEELEKLKRGNRDPKAKRGRHPQIEPWAEALRGDADDSLPEPTADEPPRPACGILLASVQPQRVEWLWLDRIPLGKLTIIDGDPGLGKSVLTLDLAARVSTGQVMPDGTPGRQGGVVLLTAEDGLGDTVRPRLDAAGADVGRILALDGIPETVGQRLPALPDDAHYIRDAVERMDARLVIVDPLTAYLGPEINSHRDTDCRRALWPLAALAEATGAAVVVVRHLNKAAGGSPLYRGGGSIGIIGAARSGLLVAKDPDNADRRVLASLKCNLARLAPSLAFDLSSAANGAMRIGWMGQSPHTAESLLAAPRDDEERGAMAEATEVLRTLLAGGGRPAKEIKRGARQAGVADPTLKRAKVALGVQSRRIGFGTDGEWYWCLPGTGGGDAPKGDQV